MTLLIEKQLFERKGGEGGHRALKKQREGGIRWLSENHFRIPKKILRPVFINNNEA